MRAAAHPIGSKERIIRTRLKRSNVLRNVIRTAAAPADRRLKRSCFAGHA